MKSSQTHYSTKTYESPHDKKTVSASAVVKIQAVSLLDVVLSVITESETTDLELNCSLEGQTCLVAGDELALAASVRALLEHAEPGSRGTANLMSAGGVITLTLFDGEQARWSAQFSEIYP